MQDLAGWMPLALAMLLVLGWYLTYSASRLDRMHHRVESSHAALDAQLARRLAAAVEAVRLLEDGAGGRLADAAANLARGEGSAAQEWEGAEVAIVEESENDLTRALRVAFGDPATVTALRADPGVGPEAGPVLDGLARACERVQLARRFHNDAVAQAQRVRRKRVVRWARLAGRAPWPQMVELDDSTPGGLLS